MSILITRHRAPAPSRGSARLGGIRKRRKRNVNNKPADPAANYWKEEMERERERYRDLDVKEGSVLTDRIM